jgi:hypothetical protein
MDNMSLSAQGSFFQWITSLYSSNAYKSVALFEDENCTINVEDCELIDK